MGMFVSVNTILFILFVVQIPNYVDTGETV
jgi:hypothetical protein